MQKLTLQVDSFPDRFKLSGRLTINEKGIANEVIDFYYRRAPKDEPLPEWELNGAVYTNEDGYFEMEVTDIRASPFYGWVWEFKAYNATHNVYSNPVRFILGGAEIPTIPEIPEIPAWAWIIIILIILWLIGEFK